MARHRKTDLKIFVVVIPREGLVGGPRQSFFWYDTDYKIYFVKIADYKSKVSVIPKEGLAGPANPSFGRTTTKILRSVFPWHRLYGITRKAHQ